MNQHLFALERAKTGLLVIDVQEKLYPHLDRADVVASKIDTIIEAFRAMDLPIVVTEQYPQGLGSTIEELREVLAPTQEYLPKTTFSCYADEKVRAAMQATGVTQWVLVGIEAHVCVMATARDLVLAGADVVVINDAISSRSIYDFSTAIGEIRDFGARISCMETALFELVHDASSPQFKAVSQLVKG